MKEPLQKWRGTPPEFAPNSRYDSLGDVTITVPVELAVFLVGIMGPLRTDYVLPDGRVLDTYNSFYVPLIDSSTGVIPKDVATKLSGVREVGRQIGTPAISTAASYAP